ncbi:hypothetical protein QQF64_032077 [Cirrhinus molitorella]|uniref:Uncharacterized protein n=2 Tax=Cirrhinus molitorella TaxID=172907 RepID=A0AA88PVY5_9TELE|nr:hypothetical protein Q8A67_010090 [Cirrhinus molitorella]
MIITYFTSTITIRLLVMALTLNIVAGNDELTSVTASCRDDITLDCTFRQDCQKYTSVTWYKLYNNSSDQSTLRFLIKSENVIQTDKHNDSVSLDENASLVLRKVAPVHSGIYKCLIRAKAGGKNCQNLVRLNISDCVSTTSPITFDFSTKFINESYANISVPLPYVDDDNSVLFVLWGCVGLAVTKLVLSAVCIWVLKKLNKLNRRRQT